MFVLQLAAITVLSVPFDILISRSPPGVGFETLISALWLLAVHIHQVDNDEPKTEYVGPILFGTAATLTVIKFGYEFGLPVPKTKTATAFNDNERYFPM